MSKFRYLFSVLCISLLASCDGILKDAPYSPIWKTPVLLASGILGGGQQISINQSGDAFAIWFMHNETQYNVWANQFNPISGWVKAEIIGPDCGYVDSLQIKLDDSGDAIAVWRTQLEGDSFAYTYSNIYKPGVGWQTATPIESVPGHSNQTTLAMNRTGDACVVYSKWVNTKETIWANRFDKESGWQSAMQLENLPGFAFVPNISIDNEGNLIAIWIKDHGAYKDVCCAIYHPGTGWEEAAVLDSAKNLNRGPEISINDSGDAVIIYSKSDGAEYHVWVNEYIHNIGWGDPVAVEYNSGTADYPQISIDRKGNIIAVWTQREANDFFVWTNNYYPDFGWQKATILSNKIQTCRNPILVCNKKGDAFSVWTQYNYSATREELWGNCFLSVHDWTIPKVISTGVWGNMEFPDLAINDAGNAIAIWRQDAGDTCAIWASSTSIQGK